MTTTPPTMLDPQATELVNELIDLQNQLEPLNARKAEIEKYLRGLGAGKYTTGVFDVTISPTRRFNKKRFAADFPADQFPNFYKPADPAVDIRAIAATVKDQYSDEYEPRITIK